jgi:hypothetical protein
VTGGQDDGRARFEAEATYLLVGDVAPAALLPVALVASQQ